MMVNKSRYSIQFRILRIIVGGGLVAITAFLIMWVYYYFDYERAFRSKEILSLTNQIQKNADSILKKQFILIQAVSQSLELRRTVIQLSQANLKRNPDEVSAELSHINKNWSNSDIPSPEIKGITDTLESKYLKEIMSISKDLISEIIVTDAFGAVRIADKKPDKFLYFDENWWQQALFLPSNEIYFGQLSVVNQNQVEWQLSIPLRSDDGIDSVGVIRVKIRLDMILSLSIQNLDVTNSKVYLFGDGSIIYPLEPLSSSVSSTVIQTLHRQKSGVLEDENYTISFIRLFDQSYGFHNLPNWIIIMFNPLAPNLSFRMPPLREALLIWIAGLLSLFLIGLILSRWITSPLSILMQVVQDISHGRMDVRIPNIGKGEIQALSESFNLMITKLNESKRKVEKLIDDETFALKSISNYIQEIARNSNISIVAGNLLRSCLRIMQGDAGFIKLNTFETNAQEIISSIGIEDLSRENVDSIARIEVAHKTFYYAWSHREYEHLWKLGYQVLMAVPIRTQDAMIGLIYLLFKDAPGKDLASESIVDVFGSMTAISIQRNRLNNQLMTEKNKLEAILTALSSLIVSIDSRYRVTWHTPNVQQFLGAGSPVSFVGQQCCSIIRNCSKLCSDCPARSTFADHSPHHLIQRWTDSSGKIRWIEASSFPLKDDQGFVKSVIVSYSDVTQRLEEEAVIHRFSQSFRSIAEGVIILDLDNNIIYANAAFETISQLGASELTNEPLEKIFPRDKNFDINKILSDTRHGKIFKGELDVLRNDRARTPVSITTALVTDESGLPINIIITCRDISERLIREKELIRRYRALHILNEISQILNHDVQPANTLVNVVEKLLHFSGAVAGGAIWIDESNKPTMPVSINIPEILSDYFREVANGRRSAAYEKFTMLKEPVIYDDLRLQSGSESKLLIRLGFLSILSFRLASSEKTFGFIYFLSSQPYQFHTDDLTLYASISAQLSLFIHRHLLNEKLIREAGLTSVGKIVSAISGDIKQVLQGLEATSHLMDIGLSNNDQKTLSDGWTRLSLEVWRLLIITQNILDYNKEIPRYYFPEDINQIIQLNIDQLKSQRFGFNLQFQFEQDASLKEVYINKLAISRAVKNILNICVNRTFENPSPVIWIKLHRIGELYHIIFSHNGARLPDLYPTGNFGKSSNYKTSAEMSLALVHTDRIASAHNGRLTIQKSESGPDEFVIEMPVFPIIKRLNV